MKAHLQRATFDMKYGGTVPTKVTIFTEVYINWPTEHFAKVAATFTLIIEHISGPVILHCMYCNKLSASL